MNGPRIFIFCREHVAEVELTFYGFDEEDITLGDVMAEAPGHCPKWMGNECAWVLTWKTR